MRALLVTAGSHGDIHPFLALGQALLARGHLATVCVNPYFEQNVRKAGLEFIALGEYQDMAELLREPEVLHPRRGSAVVMRRVLGYVPTGIPAVRRAIHELKPDVVVSHHICIGVRWICQEIGLPCAIVALSPVVWFSHKDPVPVMQRRPGGARARLARLLGRVAVPIAGWYGSRVVNRLRRELGFPYERQAFRREFRGGIVNLGLWSPHLRPPMADDPPNGRICGFPWYDGGPSVGGDRLASDLRAFLERCHDDGDMPIVFTLGTTAVYAPGDFYDVAAEACRRLGRRGVLLVAGDEALPTNLPTEIRAFRYAPFSAVFPLSSVNVHHGGIGSTAQALRAGRPSVVVPFAFDQFNNAVRVERLGVSRSLHRTDLNSRSLTSVLRAVSEDKAMASRAAELGRKLRDEDGAAEAARIIESTLQ